MIPFSFAQSATKRSSLPMDTASPLIPRRHFPSHCVSCGHTRPQTAGSALACTHFAFLQVRHLEASSIASSLLYPRHTSSKFVALTFGACSLTGTFFNTSPIICHLRTVRIRRDECHPHAVLIMLFLLLFCTSAVSA